MSNAVKADFLFELGCEELPSAAVLALSEALSINVARILTKLGFHYETIIPFAAPRRLALRVAQLNSQQPSQTISRRGPAMAVAYDSLGNPTPALLGFAKSCGVEVSNLSVVKTDKGDWLSFEATNPGALTEQLLLSIMQEAIMALPIAKPMRWGNGDNEFARPVHWLLMLYGEKVISGEILGVPSGQLSYGHRFHHPQSLLIVHPKDYEDALNVAQVVVDFQKRKQLILDQIKLIEKQLDAEAIIPDALLDEVTSIVEWPHALLAQFDKNFLLIPKEVLIASMQSHQKCFALSDRSGKLLPYFIAVTNLQSQKPEQVVAGNEKVMRARLSDAAFFFEQDRKNPLASLVPATEKVIFQAKLGTLYDKSQRLQNLMHILHSPLQLNEKEAERVTFLCKCDLMTGMVREFPELQGLMGYYYAQLDNEPLAVAVALNEQYMPRFSGDSLPDSALGTALSLADRLDTLTGAFILGEKPSGVKDPFKLRRHALAVARLLVNTQDIESLAQLIHHAASNYQSLLTRAKSSRTEQSQLSELHAFILERLAAFYQGQDIKSNLVNAVLARQRDWLFDFDQRLQALAKFIKSPEADSLTAACKRVGNLLSSASEDASRINHIDSELFQEKAEKELYLQLEAVEAQAVLLEQAGEYSAILTLLSSLREGIDLFFEQIRVLVDDAALKCNRLALLKRLQQRLQSVADIALL